jgi:hypothetical protein
MRARVTKVDRKRWQWYVPVLVGTSWNLHVGYCSTQREAFLMCCTRVTQADAHQRMHLEVGPRGRVKKRPQFGCPFC